MSTLTVGVVGGGINGSGAAWELVRRGYRVTLFEKREFGWATSSKTTKMIHGGLRYLEQLQIGLVRESLRERAYLLRHIPSLVRPIRLVFPVYRGASRPSWMIHVGMSLYDALAGDGGLPRHRWLDREGVASLGPIEARGLKGGFEFWDTQVDDRELVRAVVRFAIRDGLDARERSEVVALERDRSRWRVRLSDGSAESYDILVCVAGPWMNELLAASRIATRCRITLVRGSHVVLDRLVSGSGFFLPSPGERRVVFVLPWKGATMIGTTEVIHDGPLDDVEPSDAEIDYLVDRYNAYFSPAIRRENLASTFAGVRPLIGHADDPGAISREYHVETGDGIVSVFGGKMTTFMALGRTVGNAVDAVAGRPSECRPPRFFDEGLAA